MKTHLRKVVGSVKLTFEEMSTLLTQVEARLNSRPLVPLPNDNDNDGIEASTPGHFLIGKTLQLSLTIHFSYDKTISHSDVGDSTKPYSFTFGRDGILSTCITHIGRFTERYYPTRNIEVGDIVILHDDSPLPTKWPLARMIQVHPRRDNLVCVATIKTSTGT